MRKLNVKLIAMLAAVILVVGLGIFFLHRMQSRRQADELLNQARQAETAGNNAQVVDCLERYLALIPGDLDVSARYGIALAKMPESASKGKAFSVLEDVIKRDPKRQDARRQFIQVAMDLKQYAVARQQLEMLQGLSPDDGELEHLFGVCMEVAKDYAEAAKRYEHAIQLAPQQVVSYAMLAGLSRRQLDQPKQGDQVMDAMIAANPQSYQAYLVRGRYRLEFGAQSEDTTPAAGQQRRYRLDFALLEGGIQDFARSRELATTENEKTLAASEWGRGVRLTADAYRQTAQFAKAEPLLRQLMDPEKQSSEKDAAWARRTQAEILASRNDTKMFQEALVLLDKNLAANTPAIEDMRLKARLVATRHDLRKEAIRLFEELGRRQPLQVDEKFALVQLYENDRNWLEAKKHLQELLAKQGNNKTYISYGAGRFVAHGEFAAAQPWINRLEKLDPNAWQTTELQARLANNQGKPHVAVSLVKDYVRNKDRQALVQGAALLENLGKLAAAEELLHQSLRQSKRLDDGLPLIAFLARQPARFAEAIDLYERVWLACLWDATNFQLALNLSNLVPGSSGGAWPTAIGIGFGFIIVFQMHAPEAVAGTGVALLMAGNPTPEQCQRVAGWIEKAAVKYPQRPILLFSLANIRELFQGRYPEAEAIYRQIVEKNERNTFALNNLAWLVSFKKGKAAEGLNVIQRAIEISGSRPELLDTRAVVYMNLGRAEPAIKDLEKCIAQSPSAARYLRLARAYQMANRPDEASKALQEAKTIGVKENTLHPLEKPAYQSLLADKPAK